MCVVAVVVPPLPFKGYQLLLFTVLPFPHPPLLPPSEPSSLPSPIPTRLLPPPPLPHPLCSGGASRWSPAGPEVPPPQRLSQRKLHLLQGHQCSLQTELSGGECPRCAPVKRRRLPGRQKRGVGCHSPGLVSTGCPTAKAGFVYTAPQTGRRSHSWGCVQFFFPMARPGCQPITLWEFYIIS